MADIYGHIYILHTHMLNQCFSYFLNYLFMMLTYINIFTAIYWDHTVPPRRHVYKFIHALVFVLTILGL